MVAKKFDTPIYYYDDHVEYLKEWYGYARRFGFTQGEFNENAGIGAHSFFSDVISRRKKVGEKHIEGFVRALDLAGDEADYFCLLVRKARVRDPRKREDLLRKTAALREKHFPVKFLGNGNLEYFGSWKYPAIREYVKSKGVVRSEREISDALLHQKLSLKEIRDALKKLCAWRMVVRNEADGTYRPAVDETVISYKNMPHAVVNDVKRTLIESAVHAMETLGKERRHVSMAMRGMSRESYLRFCQRIDSLRKEFLYIDESDKTPDSVFSLNIQLYPILDIRHDEANKTGADDAE